jgi:hypothetical protein
MTQIHGKILKVEYKFSVEEGKDCVFFEGFVPRNVSKGPVSGMTQVRYEDLHCGHVLLVQDDLESEYVKIGQGGI